MRATAFIIAILICGNLAHAVIPATQGAFTQRDYRDAAYALHKRTLGEAYQIQGKKDPRWDAAAISLLDAMAIRFTNAGQVKSLDLPGALTTEELLKLARTAVDAGCDDPFVLYCYAALLDNAGELNPRSLEIASRAAAQFRAMGKPTFRVAMACFREATMSDPRQPQKVLEAWGWYRDAAIAASQTTEISGVDRRVLFNQITASLERVPFQIASEFYRGFQAAKGVDPWLRDALLGEVEIAAAWNARGKGFANTVTPQGWEEFFKHLEVGRGHLVAAWKREPGFPEAPNRMIKITMGDDGRFADTEREWFDRTVAAQVDYMPVYASMLWSLRPRWGGSHKQMYELGVECFETRRFDTQVPLQLMVAVKDIEQDTGDFSHLKSPGVLENLREMFRGMAGATKGKEADEYLSMLAAFAWRGENYVEACRVLDELGDRFQPAMFTHVRAFGGLAASHAYAMSGPTCAVVDKAERAAAEERRDEAIDLYSAALAGLKGGDKSARFLRDRLKQLEWSKQYKGGEWVAIQPDREMAGWYADNGQASVDEQGALIATFNENMRALVLWETPYSGEDFEIEIKIEFPKNVTATAGFALMGNYPADFPGFFIKSDPVKPCVLTHFSAGANIPVTLEPVNTFRIVVLGGRANGILNGKEVFAAYDVRRFLDIPRTYLGVGGKWTAPGTQVKFTSIRVRGGSEVGRPAKNAKPGA